MYLERSLENVIKQITTQFPVLLITGPRQVGKTTILRHLADEQRQYVTLDDPVFAKLARDEPQLFLERFSGPVIIDEIQYAPELLPYIKMEIDQNRQPGKYWLTGSQQFQLMRGVSESLAGRIGIIKLVGLSQWEIKRLPDLDRPFLPDEESLSNKLLAATSISHTRMYDKIWRGAFPGVVADRQADKTFFYSSYVQTYLQRDVRDLARVGDETAFLRFLQVAAARTGQLLNLADMARDADISPNTAKHWLSILETSGIIYLLQPYHSNLNKRLVKAPKLYFIDTGLCSYLTQWSDARTLEAGAMSGAMLETFVVTEILKSYWNSGLEAPLYYYRDKDKKEIDLLICQDQTLYPIEIKKTIQPDARMARHFGLLDKLGCKVGFGAIVCLTRTFFPITHRLNAIPITLI